MAISALRSAVARFISHGFHGRWELTDNGGHRIRNFMVVGSRETIDINYNWAISGGFDFSDGEEGAKA